MTVKADEISKILKERIAEFTPTQSLDETGSVLSVADGVCLSLIHISEPTRPY